MTGRRIAGLLLALLGVCQPAIAQTPDAAIATALEARFRQAWPGAPSFDRAAVGERIDALAEQGLHWQAALAAARHEADAGSAPDSAARLARLAARVGLLETAEAALQRTDSATRSERARAAIAVGRAQFESGQPEAALAALARLPIRTPADLRNRAAQVEARALLALGRAREAAQVLQNAQFDPLLLIGAPLDERVEAGVLQYNLALALLRSGDVRRGRALLDRLGTSRDADPAMRALRDRVNLALAAYFLEQQQGSTARALFDRVTLEGPFSSRALLGLGWAALAPQGRGQRNADGDRNGTRETPRFVLRAMQRRRLIDCTTFNRRALAPTELCMDPRHIERAPVPSEPEALTLEAITVWGELATRDPRDPAVRESWGALGHAAARAGRRDEAIAHYESAAERLEAALADNAAARSRLVDQGVAAAAQAALGDSLLPPGERLPADAVVRYEAQLGVDAAPGRGTSQAPLETLGLARWLAAGDPDGDGLALVGAAEARLATLASQQLDAEQRQLEGWLRPVRAALATLSDPSFRLPPPG